MSTDTTANEIRLPIKARTSSGEEHPVTIKRERLGMVLDIKGTPGKWYLSREMIGQRRIAIDIGANWYCDNFADVVNAAFDALLQAPHNDATTQSTDLTFSTPTACHVDRISPEPEMGGGCKCDFLYLRGGDVLVIGDDGADYYPTAKAMEEGWNPSAYLQFSDAQGDE